MSFQEIITQLESSLPGGIDPAKVELIYIDCLAEDLPPVDSNYRIVQGILNQTAFHLEKLKEHHEEIAAMLSWIGTEFHSVEYGGGGGWSFLNLCVDREGRQWTGLHLMQDMLVQLGIGAGLAEYMGPKEVWSAFPGGMPYVVINLKEELELS